MNGMIALLTSKADHALRKKVQKKNPDVIQF